MSDSVLPSFVGKAYPFGREAVWDTAIKRSSTGRRFSSTKWTYPIWRFKFKFEFLRQYLSYTEYSQLVAFFNNRAGAFDTFLFTDPEGSSVTDLGFGTGDGTTTLFPLNRTFGGYSEPIGKVSGTLSTVKVNGTPTAITVTNDFYVQFGSPPANGTALTWTGSYYLRCAFTDDILSADEFMDSLYSVDGVQIETIKP